MIQTSSSIRFADYFFEVGLAPESRLLERKIPCAEDGDLPPPMVVPFKLDTRRIRAKSIATFDSVKSIIGSDDSRSPSESVSTSSRSSFSSMSPSSQQMRTRRLSLSTQIHSVSPASSEDRPLPPKINKTFTSRSVSFSGSMAPNITFRPIFATDKNFQPLNEERSTDENLNLDSFDKMSQPENQKFTSRHVR